MLHIFSVLYTYYIFYYLLNALFIYFIISISLLLYTSSHILSEYSVSAYPHHLHDGTGQDCGQDSVDDYAEGGESSVLLSEFSHARGADDMGGGAHAYAFGKWIDDMTVGKDFESEYRSRQAHAHHDGGRQRGNSAQLR